MTKHEIKLLEKKEIAQDTWLYEFSKPENYNYTAGQYTVLQMCDMAQKDARGDCRTMSIYSAPFEERIKFAMRLGLSCFKKHLHDLPIGGTAIIHDPKGKFIIDYDRKNSAAFLIGGIGITPARSMVLQSLQDKSTREMYLFYSNNRPEDAPSLQDFFDLAAPNYHFIPTMTSMEKSEMPWSGETGFIREELIKKYLPEYISADYFVVGPPSFCDAMFGMLQAMNIPNELIHLDKFTGYK